MSGVIVRNGGKPAPVCEDCGQEFARPGSEGAARRPGLPEPTRCPDCRARRREDRNARMLAAYAVGSIGPPAPGALGPEAGSGPLFVAVCVACGRDIRIPFRAHADRPVYCRPCFEARHGR